MEMKIAVAKYRFVILAVVFLSYTSAMIGRLNLPPIAPFMMADLNFTHLEIGLLMAAFSFPALITASPGGYIVDRVGIKIPMVIGQLITGIFTLMTAFIQAFPQIFILRLLAGIGLGFITPATTKAVVVWFPVRERATAMGLKQTGVNMGSIICASILPILAIVYNWRVGLIITGVFVIMSSISSLIFYKEATKLTKTEKKFSLKVSWKDLKECINRDLILVSFGSMFFAIVEFSLITYLIIYAKEILFLPVIIGGILLAMVEGMGIFGKLFFGIISDRVFRGKRKPVYFLIGTIISICCIVILLIPPTAPLQFFFFLFAILGLASIGWGGLFFTLTGEFAGKEFTGFATGFGVAITMIGSTIGPPIFGSIIDLTHSYEIGWSFLALCAVIGTFLIFFLREEARKI